MLICYYVTKVNCCIWAYKPNLFQIQFSIEAVSIPLLQIYNTCVSESHIHMAVRKIAKILAAQGVSCCECPKTQYKLYSLSDCKSMESRYSLEIGCPDGSTSYRFELTLSPYCPCTIFQQYTL